MSHLERKVLVAKRNGDRPSNRPRNSHTTTFNNSDNHGSKRGNDSEEIEQPPRKRPNRNHFQESYSSTPKNLAERRLQNLRKNLETQRRQSDGNSNESPSAFATKSQNVEPKLKNPNLNPSTQNSSNLQTSSPLQTRLRQNSNEINRRYQSPLISNISQKPTPIESSNNSLETSKSQNSSLKTSNPIQNRLISNISQRLSPIVSLENSPQSLKSQNSNFETTNLIISNISQKTSPIVSLDDSLQSSKSHNSSFKDSSPVQNRLNRVREPSNIFYSPNFPQTSVQTLSTSISKEASSTVSLDNTLQSLKSHNSSLKDSSPIQNKLKRVHEPTNSIFCPNFPQTSVQTLSTSILKEASPIVSLDNSLQSSKSYHSSFKDSSPIQNKLKRVCEPSNSFFCPNFPQTSVQTLSTSISKEALPIVSLDNSLQSSKSHNLSFKDSSPVQNRLKRVHEPSNSFFCPTFPQTSVQTLSTSISKEALPIVSLDNSLQSSKSHNLSFKDSSPVQNRLKRVHEPSNSFFCPTFPQTSVQTLSTSISKEALPIVSLDNSLQSSKSHNLSFKDSSPVQNRLKRVHEPSNSFFCPNFPQTSVQTLSTSISNESSYTEQQEEEMDWTEIDEIAVVKDINDIRKEINYNKELPEAITVENNVSLDTEGVFVVCDTNIFISHLNLLDQLREKNFPDFGQVTIYIPWMVMQELDHMKESHSAPNRQSMARRANNYINTRLASKDPHFTGQLAKDYAKIEMSSKNQDDGILFSCLQLAEKRKFVILLSNDTNLRNKALVNQIPAYSSSEIISSLSNLKTEQENEILYVQAIQKIKILLSNLLTHIIQCEMKEAYGNVWDKMALMKPPFTTEEALNCLVKYWLAVFSFSLQKQCKTKLDEFVMFLRSNKNVSIYQESDFQKFVEHSLNLCIYLKNGYRNKYPDLISDCLNNIQQCADI